MRTAFQRVFGLFGLVVAVWLFGGCHDEFINNSAQIVGSGNMATRTVDLSPFSSVELAGIGDVFITQGAQQSIRLEADDNVIDRLLLDVREGRLNIGIEKASYSHTTINVYISMTSIELLELSGAGNISATGPIEANALTCRIPGAGSVTVSGRAAEQSVLLGGAGSFHGFDFESTRCSVVVSGTGSAEVTVTQRLDATISGVGSITYAGNPAEVVSHVSGVGSIRRR